MARTAALMRAQIRALLEVSATELTDPMVDSWLQEANVRVTSDARLPFFDKDYALNTVSGTQSHTLASLTGGDCAEVTRVRGPRYTLEYISHDDATAQWPTNVSASTTSEPTHYSLRAGSLYFWPKPNAIYAMVVEGIRKPLVFPSPATTPDLPDEFHECIQTYATALAYAQQDDATMAQFYMNTFDRLLEQVVDRYVTPMHARPLVMNGGTRRPGGTSFLRRSLRYPFD